MKNKNIWLLPTDKPSRLVQRRITKEIKFSSLDNPQLWNNINIYITSDEEIKEGDWFMSDFNSFPIHNVKELSEREGTLGWKQEDLKNNLKIILTTDQDLIKDGVQAIDNEFLEWFVKNPSCELVEVHKMRYGALSGFSDAGYKIIIPKEKPKQETLEEVAMKYSCNTGYYGFKRGAKWQQEQNKGLYSDDEVIQIIRDFKYDCDNIGDMNPETWFNQFKKK